MKIIIDTREKTKLKFCCDTELICLPVGDYGAQFQEGHMHNVIFERKSIGDLFGTLTFGYERFRRQIQKAATMQISMIIAIEGSKEKVLKGYSHSQRDPESILVQLETIRRKYGIEHIFFPSRISMANYIVDYYLVEYEKFKDDKFPAST